MEESATFQDFVDEMCESIINDEDTKEDPESNNLDGILRDMDKDGTTARLTFLNPDNKTSIRKNPSNQGIIEQSI